VLPTLSGDKHLARRRLEFREQLAYANVIAPVNGCEHFAQNGGRIRNAFSVQLRQRLCSGPTARAQTAQKGG
jgi:hypothetical protein